MNSFQDLNLPGAIARALVNMNYHAPTPIQAQTIPIALAKSDLIGCAQTGTGKTAAYCIPTLNQLLTSRDATALVIAPTRELAQQIEEHWRQIAQFTDVRAVSLIGGASMHAQIKGLSKRPRVIVATPGRLLDHLDRRTASLSRCQILILDEADRMLDMGFAPQLNEILSYLPKNRQTLMFTATWAPELDRLAQKYLTAPTRVNIGQVGRAATKVSQSLISTTNTQKNDTLLDELNQRSGSVLVFARTKSRTDRVARYLASFGVSVNRLHGGRTQGQRTSALTAFRTGQVRVLVATDIAARGIDVKDIAHVINYDLPRCAEDYIHRIGRTARAGASGQAVSLVTPEDRSQWHEISKLLKKTGSSLPTQASLLKA